MDIDRAMRYLDFVVERHRIWELRQWGFPPGPDGWTDDPILASKKFTNVFRILDPGTQLALRLVDEAPTDRAALMRAFLYRHTGRVEAWEVLETLVGWPRLAGDLTGVLDVWKAYRGESGRSIFTKAYLVYPQSQVPGTDKLESIIDLTKRCFHSMSGEYVMDSIRDARSTEERFEILRSRRGVGDFMAMQILTDMGYSTWWEADEEEFVAPGPGAKRGLIDLGLSPTAHSIRQVRSMLLAQPGCPRLTLQDGRQRVPSLMDVQNTLCEWSKYAREMDKAPAPVRKPYRPAHPGAQPAPALPEHW